MILDFTSNQSTNADLYVRKHHQSINITLSPIDIAESVRDLCEFYLDNYDFKRLTSTQIKKLTKLKDYKTQWKKAEDRLDHKNRLIICQVIQYMTQKHDITNIHLKSIQDWINKMITFIKWSKWIIEEMD